MFWLFRRRAAAELGILGMNRRNAACILDHNPRSPVSASSMTSCACTTCASASACRRRRSTPSSIYYSMLRRLPELLGDRGDFVVKPNRGSAGRGVLVIVGRDGNDLRAAQRRDGSASTHCAQHVSDILSGMYSLGGQPDQAIVQQRVRLHPAFEPISYKGIPDVRVILYRNEPAMAMLRLPTKESNGRANLHQGGIGTGVDLDTGVTNHAVQRNRFVERHPDTGRPRGRHARAVLGATCWACRGGGRGGGPGLRRRGHRRRRGATGRCCWRRTPGRDWPSRSPTTRGCCIGLLRSARVTSMPVGPGRGGEGSHWPHWSINLA